METVVGVLIVVAGVALYHFLEHLYYTFDARLEQKKMEKRIEYDLHYIRNWSLLLDLKIILLTMVKGFSGQNAY